MESARDFLLGDQHEGSCRISADGHSRCPHCITVEVKRRLRLYDAIGAVDSEIARLSGEGDRK